MKKEDKPFVQTYLLTGIVCLCFLIGGLLFVYFMTRQSAKESVSYLQNTAVQGFFTLGCRFGILLVFNIFEGISVKQFSKVILYKKKDSDILFLQERRYGKN